MYVHRHKRGGLCLCIVKGEVVSTTYAHRHRRPDGLCYVCALSQKTRWSLLRLCHRHSRDGLCYVCAVDLKLELENCILHGLQFRSNKIFEFEFQFECTYVADSTSSMHRHRRPGSLCCLCDRHRSDGLCYVCAPS